MALMRIGKIYESVVIAVLLCLLIAPRAMAQVADCTGQSNGTACLAGGIYIAGITSCYNGSCVNCAVSDGASCSTNGGSVGVCLAAGNLSFCNLSVCNNTACWNCKDAPSCGGAGCSWDPKAGVTGACNPSSLPSCTDEFEKPNPPNGDGIFTSIVKQIKAILGILAQKMFMGITGDPGFQKAITALLSLYIAVYGILFTFGMVQVTLFDFSIRIIKISIVAMLVGGQNAWIFFNAMVIPFFQASMDTIINWVTSIAVGPAAACANVDPATGKILAACAAPFSSLDAAITNAISAKMVVLMVTVLTTGPYGPIIGLMILLATGAFLKLMITALWVYAMALIMQALLFGLAPIFIAFILFNRTRHLFDGWLNQLVNSVMQPVLMFTFLAFFVVLVKDCIDSLLTYNICWAKLPTVFAGTPLKTNFWRFNLTDASGITQVPYPADDVEWTFTGPKVGPGVPAQPIFPIPILLALVYWVLVDLCSRFVEVCIDIAKNLAGASTDLRMGMESLGSWFSSATAGTTAGGGSGALFGGKPLFGPGGILGGGKTGAGVPGVPGGKATGNRGGGVPPPRGSGPGAPGGKGGNIQDHARNRTPGVGGR